MNTEAAEWLEAEFDWVTQDWRRLQLAERQSTACTRPMIEVLPGTDAGNPMTVRQADYQDPDGRLL
jgi:hypothetical protein